MPAELLIIARPTVRGLYEVRLNGQHKVLATSRQPFFEAARALLQIALGDPDTVLVMKIEGSETECIRGLLREAATLTVVDRSSRSPHFEKWKPHQLADGIP